MMQWFGRHWGAPLCDDAEHVDTPVGRPCGWCLEAIVADDSGVTVPLLDVSGTPRQLPYHVDCHLRTIVGGVNHLIKRCHCCGGHEPPDPPELTRREAATAACRVYGALHGWAPTRSR